jgi:hypothetical protein
MWVDRGLNRARTHLQRCVPFLQPDDLALQLAVVHQQVFARGLRVLEVGLGPGEEGREGRLVLASVWACVVCVRGCGCGCVGVCVRGVRVGS